MAGQTKIAPNAASGIPVGRLKEAIGFHLRLAQEASFRAFAERAGRAGAGLKPNRYAMLTIIQENPGLTQAALGRASRREKSTVTPALNELVRNGLVKRRASPADRRVQTLWLTAKGKRHLRELTRHAIAHNEFLIGLIGQEHRDHLMELLCRIIRGCGDYTKCGKRY
ncbi:MarR family winged helix-turn-helix transcriptional regulator [Pseudorhodoplanes sp.]|uniref:MarR family winged helix-turn-helix transcriptional regulator n=1 Tax=Pseudorhodoplanes sp. TaxID=1934341 RepID=UPI00391B7F60